jgi:hypothetical protein
VGPFQDGILSKSEESCKKKYVKNSFKPLSSAWFPLRRSSHEKPQSLSDITRGSIAQNFSLKTALERREVAVVITCSAVRLSLGRRETCYTEFHEKPAKRFIKISSIYQQTLAIAIKNIQNSAVRFGKKKRFLLQEKLRSAQFALLVGCDDGRTSCKRC